MSWRDLLQQPDDAIVLPWTGGRQLLAPDRRYRIRGDLPAEHGWYCWVAQGRNVELDSAGELDESVLRHTVKGYLVGDRLIPDDATGNTTQLAESSEHVFGVPPLDRFVRIQAGRVALDGPLHFITEDFPLGPEDAVQDAYLERRESLAAIPEVTPALEVAFRIASYQRAQAEERRAALERRRQEEEARRAREAAREAFRARVGDGEGRRAMARTDFAEAARAALQVGGAEYLDHRASPQAGEWIVRYRVNGMRLECTCDTNLRLVDSGICLTNERTGVRGDTWLSLENLPAVVLEAQRTDRLVVWRRG